MKSRTVNILDEADDFEAKLRWILFKTENEAALANHRPDYWDKPRMMLVQDPDTRALSYVSLPRPKWAGEERPAYWSPGEPLYQFPRGFRYNEQTPRPMLSEESLTHFHSDDDADEYFAEPRCTECEVYWEGNDPCFVCGDEVAQPGFMVFPKASGQHYTLPEHRDESMVFNVDQMRTVLGYDVATAGREDQNVSYASTSDLQCYAVADADSIRLIYVDRNGDLHENGNLVAWLQAEMRRMLAEEEQRIFASPAVQFRANTEQFAQSARRFGRQMQGMRAQFMVFDQWITSPEPPADPGYTVLNGIRIPDQELMELAQVCETERNYGFVMEEIPLPDRNRPVWERPVTEIRRTQ